LWSIEWASPRPNDRGDFAEMLIVPVVMRPERPVSAWQLRGWELLAPRLPRWLIVLLGRVVSRLPLGSRARRWCVLGAAVIVWDASGGSRYDLVLPAWDRACEWRWHGDFLALGFDELYRGHEGVKRSMETWSEIWTEVSFTVREVLDGGDTVLMRVTASGRGGRSGAPVRMEFSAVVRLDPLIVEYHNFSDDADALLEAGFAPAAQDEVQLRP
jgi:ketosteroid isomerase-like protein